MKQDAISKRAKGEFSKLIIWVEFKGFGITDFEISIIDVEHIQNCLL